MQASVKTAESYLQDKMEKFNWGWDILLSRENQKGNILRSLSLVVGLVPSLLKKKHGFVCMFL